jgi:HK97 family phage prohead protease
MDQTLYVTSPDHTPAEVGERTFRFVFSDGSVDIQGDRLNVKGWDLDQFNRNPVDLWNHSTDNVIGRASNFGVENNKLKGDITFAAPEVLTFADEVYKLVQNGFVKGVSVGFVPIEYEYSDEPDRNIDYFKQKLLEISVAYPVVPGTPICCIVASRAATFDSREWACSGKGTISERIPGELSGRGELRGVPV